MIIEKDNRGGTNWFSARLFSYPHVAVGKTKEDVQESFQTAISNGTTKKKLLGVFPLGQEMGQSINKIDRWVLKAREIASKVAAIVPILGGLMFLNNAANLLGESGGNGPEGVIGGITGLVGLAAITLGPILAWKAGETYKLMHNWMKNEAKISSGYIGQSYYPGSRS